MRTVLSVCANRANRKAWRVYTEICNPVARHNSTETDRLRRLVLLSCAPRQISPSVGINLPNDQNVAAKYVNRMPGDLGDGLAALYVDPHLAFRHQGHSGYRPDHAGRTRVRPRGATRSHWTGRCCIVATAAGAIELAHTRLCDRRVLWSGLTVSCHEVDVTGSLMARHDHPRCTDLSIVGCRTGR